MTETKYPLFYPSKVEPFKWEGLDIFIKRDDLIDPRFSGNKYRKLYALFKVDSSKYKKLISYGGAQSNAMLSLAYLAQIKGLGFEYYTKKIPKWLNDSPIGNLKRSLELDMKLFQLPHDRFYETINRVKESISEDTIFVPQGGAFSLASEGIKILADEVIEWMGSQNINSLSVVTPSGTGTTSFYLAKFLPRSVDVYTTPVIGDADTLKSQWSRLDPLGGTVLPKILDSFGKYPFSKPNIKFHEVYKGLKESGIEFDLIYAPKMWLEIKRACYLGLMKKPILYIHSGGTSGNISQIKKYERYFEKHLLRPSS